VRFVFKKTNSKKSSPAKANLQKNMHSSDKSKSKKFIKVCPNCFSGKLNSHLGLTGEGYMCMDCGFDNFYPLEIEEKNLKKLR